MDTSVHISNQLYEDDARIGHQEFDLKLTSRVKMSMVDRPSFSLNIILQSFYRSASPRCLSASGQRESRSILG